MGFPSKLSNISPSGKKVPSANILPLDASQFIPIPGAEAEPLAIVKVPSVCGFIPFTLVLLQKFYLFEKDIQIPYRICSYEATPNS